MSLIISVCPHCNNEYINEDSVEGFSWFCSVSCERNARKPKDPDTTKADVFEEVTDEISEEVFDSGLFRI